MITKEKKTYTELGYTRLDTAEIVTFLNRLISELEIFQQKLRNFGWNVSGRDFLSLHNLFADMNTRVLKEIDKVAERIKLFGENPVSNYAAFQQLSEINFQDTMYDSTYEMVKIIIDDIRKIIECMGETIQTAQGINDYGTEFLVKSMVYNLEREHWMLTEWLKNTY